MTPEQLDKIAADRDTSIADQARALGMAPKALYRSMHNYRKKLRYADAYKVRTAAIQEVQKEIELAKQFGPHHIPILVNVRNAIEAIKV